MLRRNSRIRSGFTLVEAALSVGLLAVAASVLLLGVHSSVETTDEAMNQTIAMGMARQLLDEALGCRYMEYGASAYDSVLCPGSAEAATGNRTLFDDIDDFNGWKAQPPVDAYGLTLGVDDGQGGQRNPRFQISNSYFSRWKQEVQVYYVSESNPLTPLPIGQTSDRRAVQVRILYVDPVRGPLELAKLQRVVTYIPPLPN